jgi:hypothetical protein
MAAEVSETGGFEMSALIHLAYAPAMQRAQSGYG